MPIRSERLEKRIQEIQQFVSDRIERDQIFEAVSKELLKIADILKQGKITVQIVSYNRVSAQKLQHFLHKYDALKEAYRFSPILQIGNLNITNDTSANGQQLHKYKTLQSGDRITLGYEKQPEESTELLSGYYKEFYQQFAECNILCLVIAPKQMHKIDQIQLIEQISKTQISTVVVVVEMPEVAGESALQANTIKDEVLAWLQSHSHNKQKIEVYSTSQSELETFCHSLGTLNKRIAEDILINQLAARLLTQLTLIEKFLIKKVTELETEIQQVQASLLIVGGDQIRKFDETIRLINNDKASSIKEIKSSVNKLKG